MIQLLDVDKVEDVDLVVYQQDPFSLQVLKGGLFPLKREKEDLAALLRDVVIDVLNNPTTRSGKYSSAQQELIVFPCDRSLLQRAFTNLIYNAVVHNPADTEIHVSIEKTEKIYVRIQDNGRGISQEELANLFERYYRGTSTEENQQGSGLGMAIAKQIIEIHGGIIIVESTIGVGTLVTVLF